MHKFVVFIAFALLVALVFAEPAQQREPVVRPPSVSSSVAKKVQKRRATAKAVAQRPRILKRRGSRKGSRKSTKRATKKSTKKVVSTMSDSTAAKCTTDALRVRSKPSTSGATLRTLPKGASVNVISTNGGWATIGNGQYVSAQYLKACGAAPRPSSPRPAAPTPAVSGGSNCGQSYVSGVAKGQKQCVNIDGKPVVTTTATAFNKMKAAARAAGVTLRINSGFRTQAEQQRLYNCYLTKRCNNGNLAAKPGFRFVLNS